jgi:hypothetical protein
VDVEIDHGDPGHAFRLGDAGGDGDAEEEGDVVAAFLAAGESEEVAGREPTEPTEPTVAVGTFVPSTSFSSRFHHGSRVAATLPGGAPGVAEVRVTAPFVCEGSGGGVSRCGLEGEDVGRVRTRQRISELQSCAQQLVSSAARLRLLRAGEHPFAAVTPPAVVTPPTVT